MRWLPALATARRDPVDPLLRFGLDPADRATTQRVSDRVLRFQGTLLNRRSVILGSIAAELSTLWENAGATSMPRVLSAATPLDSMFRRAGGHRPPSDRQRCGSG